MEKVILIAKVFFLGQELSLFESLCPHLDS